MKFKINKELAELNNIFKTQGVKLFVVGGFVRDSLLGLNPTDVDLASQVTNEQLFKMLNSTGFTASVASAKLGTTIISKNKVKFEHTTFRTESYKQGGFHSPEQVEFVKSLKVDANRRDFTINSMYYDLQEEKVVDLHNGQKHLKKGVVKAIISPEYVFASDGLRILRMIRLASELGFKIDKKTYKTAKQMITQLKDVSKDRLFKEFGLILIANFKYGNNEVKGAELLIQLNALEYIFPNLSNFASKDSLIGLATSLHHYNKASCKLVFEAFMLDLCLYVRKLAVIDASTVVAKLLDTKNTGVSKEKRQSVIDLIKAYEKSIRLQDDYNAKVFIQEHEKVICNLLELLYNSSNKEICDLLQKNYDYMKQNNMPFNLKQLKVNGTTLKEYFKNLDDKLIGKMLAEALKFCLLSKSNNTKVKILDFLAKKFKEEKHL